MKFDCVVNSFLPRMKNSLSSYLMFRESLLAVTHNVVHLKFSLTDISNAERLRLVQNRLGSSVKT